MSISITPESLLQQIAQIQLLERGTVSINRQGPNGPYYNHQVWEDGKNVSHYVPKEQVEALQQAIAGYEKFQGLVEQYVLVMEQKSLAQRQGSKKKPHRLRSSLPKTRKSSN